jgi:hypothetical protein
MTVLIRRSLFVLCIMLVASTALAAKPKVKGKPGGTTSITSTPLTSNPGWDTLSWTANPSTSWTVKINTWDPGYMPTSDDDAGGNILVTNVTSDTVAVTNMQLSYNTKGRLLGYYLETGQTYYQFLIWNYTSGGGNPVKAWGPFGSYNIN